MATIKTEKREVTFIFDAKPNAKQVYVAGDFNQWNPTDKKMTKAKDGSFRACLKLTRGKHQYKFIADGAWVSDNRAQKNTQNEFGTVNSVVEI